MRLAEIRRTTGMVIPVWFAPTTPSEQIANLLSATLQDWETFMLPERVIVVLDGCEWCEQPLKEVQQALKGTGWQCLLLEQNRGKGGAVLAGLQRLLTTQQVDHVVVRDSDNDHWLSDLPRLWQLAKVIERERQTRWLMVIGRRAALHFPMSFSRGEWERLTDEVLLEAAKFALAREGKVPDLTYCAFHTLEPPDFLSGYKLFTAEVAQWLCQVMEEESAKFPDLDLLRYGWEGVPCLALLLSDGIIGEVQRMTYRRQPVTGYGDAAIADLYGRQIAYALRRCNISGETARRLFDNAARKSLLWTQEPQRTTLLQVRQHILSTVNAPLDLAGDEERFF